MTIAPERHLRPVEDDDRAIHMADIEAERTVLGLMMLSSQACDQVFDLLASRDFADPRHRSIHLALLTLWGQEQPTDPVSVARFMATNGELTSPQVTSYLHSLIADVAVQAGTPTYYAEMVKDWAERRRAREAVIRALTAVNDLSRPVADVLDVAGREIADARSTRVKGGPLHLAEFGDAEIEYLEKVVAGEIPHGISSGIGQLDDIIGGFLPGQLIVVAGRPGMGKTVASVGFAVAAARRGRPALITTLEMSKRELMWRIWARVGRINLSSFTSGRLTREELDKARRAKEVTDRWPLHVDENAKTIADIRASGRRFRQRTDDWAIWTVDYLQRIRSVGRAERRDLEVGGWCREFKHLSQELETSVVLGAQINRGNEQRSDKRPQLSDLRDSGEIEQEADIVILLHREDYYDKESPRAGEADFDIAKHRNGPTDTVQVAAQLHYAQFVDWDTPEETYR